MIFDTTLRLMNMMMKNSILFFLLIVPVTIATGQPRMELKVTEHDFGVFREEAGKQTFTFTVINTGDKPLVIQNIVPSCGCTTPDWTRTPIAPGEEGSITAVYDPTDRPGRFSKTLSVYSNSKPSPIVLSIKGEVAGRVRTAKDFYIWQVGTLRFQGNNISFPEVLNTEKRIRVLPVINTSESPVRLEFENMPSYIELKAIPAVLKPGQKGIVECIYYGNRVSKWGSVRDAVKIKLDGKVQSPDFYIMAVVMEDFSKLTKYELADAPLLKMSQTRINLGQVTPNMSKETEISFTNEGKRNLIIRNISSSCTCLKVTEGKDTVIVPGGSGSVKVVFSSEKMAGKMSRPIYIFTNDPKNSRVTVVFQADINPVK